jgi:MFS family permease
MRWLGGVVVAIGYVGNIMLAHTQFGFHDPHPDYPYAWAMGSFPIAYAVWEAGHWLVVQPLWLAADVALAALSIYGGAVVGEWIARRNSHLFRSFNALLFMASMVLGGTIFAVLTQRSTSKAILLWLAIIGQVAPCLAIAGIARLLRYKRAAV